MLRSCAFLFVLSAFIIACSSPGDKDITGTWETVRYYVEQSGDPIDQSMTFEFDSTGSYTVDYGSVDEKGNYWISYDKLFTKEEGEREKSVQIERLDKDTMVLEMNRSGRIEILVLARK